MNPKARRIANLLNGSTLAGLLLSRSGSATIKRGPRGMLIAENYRGLTPPHAAAFTVGNVVITPGDLDYLIRLNSRLLRHEEVHADQWASWLGFPFIFAYLGASAYSYLTTRTPFRRNYFERQAGLEDGNYVSRK